jgi:hypothetical protein
MHFSKSTCFQDALGAWLDKRTARIGFKTRTFAEVHNRL